MATRKVQRLAWEVVPSRGGARRSRENRFTPLDVEADAIPALSRPKEFAMTECSDTEVEVPSWRLRLVWNNPVQDIPDSHDQRVARVRDAMIEERRQRQVWMQRFSFPGCASDGVCVRGSCSVSCHFGCFSDQRAPGSCGES